MTDDSSWFEALTRALDQDGEAEVLDGVAHLLGPGGTLTAWRPGREEWLRHHGPVDVLPSVPEQSGVHPSADGLLVRAGEDPTASRLVWVRAPELADNQAMLLARLLRLALDRLLAREQTADVRQRLADNERIGRLGSYDWHVPTDTNRWSDELYRIYGEEPQSFNASYERFLAFIHPDDRDKVREIHQQAFATGEPYTMEERIVLADGTERLLWSNGEVIPGPDGAPERFIGICRDVTDQRAAERAAREVEEQARLTHDATIRRRAALELNDVVVQGLTAAIWACEADAPTAVAAVLRETLADAQRMMGDLLGGPGGDQPAAGQLRRTAASPARVPAGVPARPSGPAATTSASGGGLRVVLADDSADMRMLLRLELVRHGIEVLGEAEDGRQAVELAAQHAPDVVLLDLSMPVMDGLEAARAIRQLPGAPRILVVSGYGASSMAEAARQAGADDYVEKGADLGPRVLAALGLPVA